MTNWGIAPSYSSVGFQPETPPVNPSLMSKASHLGSKSSSTPEKALDPPLEGSTIIESGLQTQNHGDQQSPNDPNIANPVDDTSPLGRVLWDVARLGGMLVLIIWPWAFFGVVSAKNGLPMSDRLAEIVSKYPQRVAAVVTLIGTVNQFAATFLFGQAIVRLGQELIGRQRPKDNESGGPPKDDESGGHPKQDAHHQGDMTVFRISALSAFRHMTLVWGIGTWNRLAKGKPRLVVLVLFLATWGAVQLVPSGTAGLITPGQVTRDAEVLGMELDFTSSDPECLSFMEANRVNNTCDWRTFKNTRFTTCLGENQILDVLDSGRANMLFSGARMHNQMSFLNQLGVDGGGIRFLGSIKGILPLGPNGVPGFNFQNSSDPFIDSEKLRRIVSYNYTLNHQGLNANVSCSYNTTSPIEYYAIDGVATTGRVLNSNGTCAAAGLQDVLENVHFYPTLNTNNTLTYWACKQIPQPGSLDPTYFVYLRGRMNYRTSIGNITCRISPMRAQDYSVRYESLLGYFVSQSTTDAEQPPLRSTFYRFVEWGLVGLGNVIWETQNWSANMFAEAVFSAAAKNFNLTTNEKHDQYLPLYEALIEGVLDYQATYSRLIYALGSNPPEHCLRNVTGPVSYSVRGWFVGDSFTQAGLLIPMTLVNLVSLCLLLACFFIGKFRYSLDFDMTDNLALLTATVGGEKPGGEGEIAWTNPVTFPHTTKPKSKS